MRKLIVLGVVLLLFLLSASGTGQLASQGKTGNCSASQYLVYNATSNVYVCSGPSNTSNASWGLAALNVSTTGTNNTAGGFQSLFSNTSGVQNSAQGVDSLHSNTTGGNNTAQGFDSLYANTTGSYNTAQGVEAGWFIADGSTPNQTSSNSLYLGAGTKSFANGDTNEIVIGYNAIGAGSNTVTLGNTSITATVLHGETTTSTLVAATSVTSPVYKTTTACASSASPALCNTAAAGAVVIAAAATSVNVKTDAVTEISHIQFTRDDSLSAALGVTCNTQSSLVLGTPRITAKTAGAFTITLDVAPTTNPMCGVYFVVNK